MQEGNHMIRMELGKNSYNIEIERGNLAKAGTLLNLNRKVLVLTDEGVPRIYAETIAAQCRNGYIKVVPQGEGSKEKAENGGYQGDPSVSEH